MYTGPKTINNGLVYGYDTGYGVADNGNSTRFYPGEPTVNLMTSHFESLSVDGSGQSSVGTRTTIGTNHVKIVDNASNTRQSVYISGLTASTTYTLSNQFKKISGTPTWRYQIQAYNNSSYVSTIKFTNTAEIGLLDIDGWQTAKWTFTLPANSNRVLVFFQDGADYTTYDHSFEVKNPQLEAKGHATFYVDGTRSATASLIDLKRNNNIDMSYMSFNSTSQPTFDGTDDYILTPFTRGTLGDQLTMIAYYKFDGSTGRTYTPIFGGKESGTGTEFFIGKNSGNTNIGVQDGNYSGSFVTGSNAWDGNYHQIVYTYENGSGRIYLDGVEKSAGTFSKCNAAEQITVGSEVEGTGYYMIGDIPRVCVFDRVFTAEEVLKDFNANKNRFNI